MLKTLKLYFDGSCGPKNPGGYACWAFVLTESNNDSLLIQQTGVECHGEGATNNVAEYAGLKHGLQYIIQEKLTKEVEIFGDSKLVINQINGEWKCKSDHLKHWLVTIHELLDHFTIWNANWIPRNENSLADGLSKWESVLNE